MQIKEIFHGHLPTLLITLALIITMLVLIKSSYAIDLQGDYGSIVEASYSFAYTLFNKGFEGALKDFIFASRLLPFTFDRFLVFIFALPYVAITKLLGVQQNLVIVSNIVKISVISLKILLTYLLLRLLLHRNISNRIVLSLTVLAVLLDNYWLTSIFSDAIDRPLIQLFCLTTSLLYTYILLNKNIGKIPKIMVLVFLLQIWLISVYHPHTILVFTVLNMAFFIVFLLYKTDRLFIVILAQVLATMSLLIHIALIYPFHGPNRSMISYVLSQRIWGLNYIESLFVLNTEKPGWKDALIVGYFNSFVVSILILLNILIRPRDIVSKFSKIVFLTLIVGMFALVNYRVYGYLQYLLYLLTNNILLYRTLSRFYMLYGIALIYGLASIMNSIRNIGIKRHLRIMYSILTLVMLTIYTLNSMYIISIKNYDYVNEFYNDALEKYYNANELPYGTLIMCKNLPITFTLNSGAYSYTWLNDIQHYSRIAKDYVYKLFGIRYVIDRNCNIKKINVNSRIGILNSIVIPLTSLKESIRAAQFINSLLNGAEKCRETVFLAREFKDLRKITLNDSSLSEFTLVVVFTVHNLNSSLRSIIALGDPNKGTGFWIAQDYDFLTIEMNLNGKWERISTPRVLKENSTYILIMIFDGKKGYLSLYLNGISILRLSDVQGSILNVSKRAYIGNTPNGIRRLNGVVYYAGLLLKAFDQSISMCVTYYFILKYYDKIHTLRFPLISYTGEHVTYASLPILLDPHSSVLNKDTLKLLTIPKIIIYENKEDIKILNLIIDNNAQVVPFSKFIKRKYMLDLLLRKYSVPMIRYGVVVPRDHKVFDMFSIESYKYDIPTLAGDIVAVKSSYMKYFNNLNPKIEFNARTCDSLLLRTIVTGSIWLKVEYYPANITRYIYVNSEFPSVTYINLTSQLPNNKNIDKVQIKLSIYKMDPGSLIVFDSIICIKCSQSQCKNTNSDNGFYAFSIEKRQNLGGSISSDLVINTASILNLLNNVPYREKLLYIFMPNKGYMPNMISIDDCRRIAELGVYKLYTCGRKTIQLENLGITYNLLVRVLILFIENILSVLSILLTLYYFVNNPLPQNLHKNNNNRFKRYVATQYKNKV